MVRNAFQQAYNSQLEYTKLISEIKAIEPARNYAEIAANVRELSDAFNQPLAVVAEAQYETLSDQFTSAAEQADILSAANTLAKTTEDDLVGSTQLLTGALNAYGESSEMAGVRSAQFFESINLGRFRATELGTALSRVQSIGAELGISMEELQAGLIAITIGGVKAREASTQLRGIFNALLKPSEAMKKALREIGVESGPAAVRTFGFHGALKKLKGTTDGTSTAIAQLIPRVRAVAGAFRLLGEGATPFAEAQEKLEQLDVLGHQAKALEAMGTEAAKLTKELNKLRNFFTVELGADVVSNLNALIDLLGGGKGLVGILRMVTSEGPKAVIVIGLMTLAMQKFGVAIDWAAWGAGFNLGIRKLNTFRAAFALFMTWEIGRLLGAKIGDMIDKSITEPFEREREALEQSVKLNEMHTATAIRIKDHENTEISRKIRQHVISVSASYREDLANFQSSMKFMESAAGRAFDNILQRYKRLSDRLGTLSSQMGKKSRESFNTAFDIRQGIKFNKMLFEIQQWSPERQFSEFASALSEATRKAAALQRIALDETQQKSAAAAWSRVDALKQMVQTSAKGRWEEREAMSDIAHSDERRADSYEHLGKLQQRASVELEKRNRISEEHYSKLVRGADMLKKKLEHFTEDEAGITVLKKPEDALKDLAEFKNGFEKWKAYLERNAVGDFKVKLLGDAKALEDMRQEAERMLASIYLKDLQILPETIAGMWDALQASADQVRLKVKVIAEIEALTGKNIVSDGLDDMMKDFDKRVSESMAKGMNSAKVNTNIEKFQKSLTNAFESATKRVAPLKAPPTLFANLDNVNQARANISAFIELLNQTAKSSEISSAALREVGQAALALDLEGAFPSLMGKLPRGMMTEELIQMLNALRNIKAEQDKLREIGPVDQQLQQKIQSIQQQSNMQDQLNSKVMQEKAAIDSAKVGIDNQISAINRAIADANSLASSWHGVASAIASAAAAAAQVPSGGVVTAAFGGVTHFDRGGFARGIDTVPAMLSKGEFVMNSKAAQQWNSQLVAMNSGGKPNFKSEGGSTTNAGIIGDVSVNVSGGANKQTGRDIVTAINREIRRGTSRLR